MKIKRLPAKKSRIVDLLNGKFFPGNREEKRPGYVITPFGEKISRVNLVGTVTGKDEEENSVSVILDDSTASLTVRHFGDRDFFSSLKVGSLIMTIGRVREFNGEIYLSAETAKEITNPNYESLRKLEIFSDLVEKIKITNDLRQSDLPLAELRNLARDNFGLDEESLTVVLESKKLEIDCKPKILEAVQSLDQGEGAELGRLLEATGLPENLVESAINELLESGMLYEPVVGKWKRV